MAISEKNQSKVGMAGACHCHTPATQRQVARKCINVVCMFIKSGILRDALVILVKVHGSALVRTGFDHPQTHNRCVNHRSRPSIINHSFARICAYAMLHGNMSSAGAPTRIPYK